MAVTAAHRIALITRGRYDEFPASADVYPGMLLQQNSSLQVAAHAVVGGGGPILVCQEDALSGGSAPTKIASGSIAPVRWAARGDKLSLLLKSGQSITQGATLMSGGDGSVVAGSLNQILKQILAASTTITNTASETAFDNSTVTIAANTLQAGDVIHIRAKAIVSAENSTNTHRIRVYINSQAIADSGAIALAAAEYYEVDLYLLVRSIGATGKIVVDGFYGQIVATTGSAGALNLASTTLDTTAAATLTVKSLASAASTGNVIALQQYEVDIQRAGGNNIMAYAAETVDNSANAGSTPMSDFTNAAFIRAWMP